MTDLAGLLAQKFIARKDVKAVQTRRGEYMPVQHCTECGRGFCDHETPKVREGWARADIEAHLAGNKTYGHYLLNEEDQCKLFAFDVDLEKDGIGPDRYLVTEDPKMNPWDEKNNFLGEVIEFSPRDAWLDRAHPQREWLKAQLKQVAHGLAASIQRDLGLQCAVAYTGSKGIHVYGFTGLISAADAREGAMIVLDSLVDTHLQGVTATRGTNFFKFVNQDPIDGQPNVMVEVFPKQDSLEGKDLGNLLRMPLGVNLKNPKDPTFFVDMTGPLRSLKPVDPAWALTNDNVFRAPGE